jgi:hypothetical protein
LQRVLLQLAPLLGGFLLVAELTPAMVPSSSLRSPPGIVTSVSPLERRFMTAVIAVSGRDIPRPSRKASKAAAARIAVVPRISVRWELAEAASYSEVSLTSSSTATGWPA